MGIALMVFKWQCVCVCLLADRWLCGAAESGDDGEAGHRLQSAVRPHGLRWHADRHSRGPVHTQCHQLDLRHHSWHVPLRGSGGYGELARHTRRSQSDDCPLNSISLTSTLSSPTWAVSPLLSVSWSAVLIPGKSVSVPNWLLCLFYSCQKCFMGTVRTTNAASWDTSSFRTWACWPGSA